MYKKIFFLIGSVLFLSASLCFAQNAVSVNMNTGTANVQIPIYNVLVGSVSVPISLVYSATGVRPNDVEETAGMNWQLEAGGQVSRQVRGLPDDQEIDADNNPLPGWMHNTNQAKINSFIPQNNGSTCSYETADISTITTNFGNLYDTEPDIFSVSAPGLSCQLVYDQSISNFRTIPYQDLNISCTYDSDGGITSFTIINDKGTKYVFSTPEAARLYTETPASPVNFFKNTYTQYQGDIQYNDAWFLTYITGADGMGVSFNYTTAPVRSSTDSVNLFIAGSTTPTLEYRKVQSVWAQTLSSITVSNSDDYGMQLSFNWSTNSGADGTGQTYISSIKGMGKDLEFTYSPVTYTRGNGTVYVREFLRNFADVGCGSPVNYNFGYIGETNGGGGYTTVLPDSTSNKFDYWGYYSTYGNAKTKAINVVPSNSAYQRYTIATVPTGSNYTYTIGTTNAVADTVNEMAGTLNTISYAQGGSTTITYQSNDYLDVPSGTVVKGGGIRVKQIVDYDGINTANNIVRNYSYINPTTSKSSGKPITLPSYAFTIPYTGGNMNGALWTSSTAISNRDLSTEDHTILYEYVTMSMTGAGSSRYQYYVPATNWDYTAECYSCSTADWAPTENYIGRTNCASNYGQVRNDIYSYPLVPNTNYDFERGLLKQVINYNNAVPAKEVSESNHTYQRSGAVVAIPALKFDYNSGTSGVLAYSKYNIYTNTSELISQVVNKVYDSPTQAQAQQSTVSYTYATANHRQLIKQTTTNSDNTTLINNIKYVKDFNVTSPNSNANINALYNLQLKNINAPVESWSQVQNGSTVLTTAATLTLYRGDTIGTFYVNYLPSQQLKFVAPDGLAGFAASSISGTMLNKNGNYVPVANFTAYDYLGELMTMDDAHHHVQSVITGSRTVKPTIKISNAAATELAFDDCDGGYTQPFTGITVSGTVTSTTNGHTGSAIVLSTGQTLSQSLTKNLLAVNYIASAWIKSTTAGTMTIALSSGSPSSFTRPFTNTGGKWRYFEWKIPVSSITGTFTITESANVNINIDDVLFYPENAEVTTYAYNDTTLLQTAVTNTNGISTYYKYDQWGRLLYAYDRDKNILQRNAYVTPADAQDFTGVIHGPTSAATSDFVYLYTNYPTGGCNASSTTYTWTFGDGSPSVTTATYTAPGHLYITPGTYTPTLTINNPIFGTSTRSGSPITVTAGTFLDVTYNNTTTARGVVAGVSFYQGTSLMASYTEAQLKAGINNLAKGSYTVKITMNAMDRQFPDGANNDGYGSVGITYDTGSSCINFCSIPPYTFGTVNLSTANYITINVQTSSGGDCGGGNCGD